MNEITTDSNAVSNETSGEETTTYGNSIFRGELPSTAAFAAEVKADRLNLLWKILVAIVSFLIMVLFVFGAYNSANQIMHWYVSLGILLVGSLLTGRLLRDQKALWAMWLFTITLVSSVAVPWIWGDENALRFIPFAYPIVVFFVGLLLPPSQTMLTALGCSAILLLGPPLFNITTTHPVDIAVIAIIMTFLSALLAVQVTGELYQVAQWALMNYQRERRTTDALFEKRQELQKALLRSQALSDQLKEANVELEAAREAAERAKQFRGQFLANMSHELRTPLNAIIGFSETMLKFPVMYDDIPLPEAYRGDLEQINTSGQQLLAVINDILDLARVDAGKLEIVMQRVELTPIIESVLATARGLAASKHKPLKFAEEIPSPPPLCWADDKRLRQVLLNLYSNAVKYTDEGSISLSITTEGDHVKFAVTDTGVGIAPDEVDKVFEEFQQVGGKGRDPRSGAGLGLAISRQLVTLMGGRIWAESELGKGSTFYFTVPAYRQQDKVDVPARPKTGPLSEQTAAQVPSGMKGDASAAANV
ncbi:MAG: sensor histidine kinase [Chloroflexi bacterium]|nr:MAG: sensor histidine kinase [Chloroflexota bacterium]